MLTNANEMTITRKWLGCLDAAKVLAVLALSVICILIVFVLGFLASGFFQGNRMVRIIVPTDHEGLFAIKADSACNPVITVNGVATIEVPKNGMACVKDINFLTEWHTPTLELDDGTVIPDYFAFANPPDGNIVVWCDLFATSDAQYYYIGKAKNKQKLANTVAPLSSKKLEPYMLRRVEKAIVK
jgi:hypothetical protein